MVIELYTAIKDNGDSLYIHDVEEIKTGFGILELLTASGEVFEIDFDNVSRIQQ